MKFSDKYPNLTWWLTCLYYVLHNDGNSITLYDQGREVWDTGDITNFDEALNVAETWVKTEYNNDSSPIGFKNWLFSEKYPHLTRWFTNPKSSMHNRGDILLNLYNGSNLVWDSGEMTDVDAIFGAAEMWICQKYKNLNK